jgi:5-methylthioadenosine/S-adenosylhomocysteine deaminase
MIVVNYLFRRHILIKITNAKLLLFEDKGKKKPVVQDGDLVIDGGKIVFSGPVGGYDRELAKLHKAFKTVDIHDLGKGALDDHGNALDGADLLIDAGNCLIIPGFKDAHTHSAMTLFRSFADDLPLHEWLYNRIFPLESRLTDERVYWGATLAIMEYLSSGITANFDMYMHNDANVKASVDAGFRTVLCGSINNFGGTVDDMEGEFKKYNKEYNRSQSDRISYRLGFHAEYTTSREILEGMAALAHKYKAPVFTHNSETRSEVEECIGRYGMTPTVFLDSLGMFDYGGGGFHCVHMTDQDIDLMLEHHMFAVTNPGSNVKLASGIAPVQKYLDKGVNLAIGTDGPASNNSLDMFREMYLTTVLQKVSIPDASAADADLILSAATAGGALCCGLNDSVDLSAGMNADIAVIDLMKPDMQPLNNISKNLVYAGSKDDIIMTMVGGLVLFENGHYHIGVEPAEVYEHVNQCISEMKKVFERS